MGIAFLSAEDFTKPQVNDKGVGIIPKLRDGKGEMEGRSFYLACVSLSNVMKGLQKGGFFDYFLLKKVAYLVF